MIIRNKLTKETLEFNRVEFEKQFSKEIKTALDSYTRTHLAKPYFRMHQNIESDFYFDLPWNFNHFSNSNWYIERI